MNKHRQPTNHPRRFAAVAVVLAAVVIVVLVIVFTPRLHTTDPAPAVAMAPVDRLKTPQAQAYFATLYADALIGPKDLTADHALQLGEQVCAGLRAGNTVNHWYAYVRDVTKLNKMQAARLVDAADRDLCRR